MTKRISGILLLAFFFITQNAFAQTDDLMIVEYIDSEPGSGFGVTIFNPTSRPVNMSGYRLGAYNNGSTSGSETALSGTIAPGGYTKVGNSSYCTPCASACNFSSSSSGVNGNDAVVLKGPNGLPVDMIGLYGVDVFNMVDGVRNGLLHTHLNRDPANCIRYTSVDGVSPNSWPNTSAVNVQGWTVTGVTGSEACLRADFTFSSTVAVRLPADTSFCEGERVRLSVTPGSGLHYQWNTGDTTASITVDSTGRYTVIGSRNGCLSRDTIQVVVHPLPSIHFMQGDTSMCTGDSVTLAVADSAGWHYQWNTMDTTVSITVSDSGYYALHVVHNTCKATDSVHVALRALPVFSLGRDTGFCKGDTLLLAVADSADWHYEWSNSDTISSTEITQPGTYSLTLKQKGCAFSDTVSISEHQVPHISLGPDIIVCEGTMASLSATVDLDTLHYRWSNGDTTNAIQAGSGSYSLLTTTYHGCTGSDTIGVTEEGPVQFSIGTDRTLCIDSTLVLAPTQEFAHYAWSTGDTLQTLTVNAGGTFSLVGISSLGCESQGPAVTITPIPCNFTIPNVFTPANNDQENDSWKLAQPFLTQARVIIHSRWGKQVYESTEPDFAWDGKNASPGIYFYYIEGTTFEGKAFKQKGTIELVR